MNQTALTTREQAVTSSAALVEASVYKGQEMNTAAKKAERERRVFQKFITTSKLSIVPESVESRPPPEPDILCLDAQEGHIAFELVEICDESLARKLSAIDKEEFGFLRSQDSSWAVLRKKLRKSYLTGHPRLIPLSQVHQHIGVAGQI
jgi:hypothetical protein